MAGIIVGTDRRQGCLLNIVVGVIGALIGGVVVEFLTGEEFSFAFNVPSFAVAVVGAVILLIPCFDGARRWRPGGRGRDVALLLRVHNVGRSVDCCGRGGGAGLGETEMTCRCARANHIFL